MAKRVLVTGHLGYVGAVTTRVLSEAGIDVTVIPHLYDLKADSTGMLALKGISGRSSKPTTDKSSGTRKPNWPATLIIPAAISSLLAKIAVGLSFRRNSRIPHSTPDSNVLKPCATSCSSNSSPLLSSPSL